METNGFSTDRGANQGVMVATWAASGEGSLELDRAVPSLLFSRYFASPLRSVSMSASIYQAAMLDPHTAAELSMDDIIAMCDDLIEAHGDWIPKFEDRKTISFI
jgi:hypothetical protein